jgi:glycosyltransferase involved in cell wall biosynthesis
MRRLLVQWYRFLPYHFARIEASRQLLGPAGFDVQGLEIASQDQTYRNIGITNVSAFPRHVVFPNRNFHTIPTGELRDGIWKALDDLQPDAVATCGYGLADGRSCVLWCLRNRRPVILMSESWEGDAPRHWLKERVKSQFVKPFDAAMIGGRRHRDYLVSLGMPDARIFDGYDAIDNDFFAKEAAIARRNEEALRQEHHLPQRYFLSCGRFVPEKNFSGLIDAFARYRQAAGQNAWDLVVLGDGEEMAALRAQAEQLGLGNSVHFPGFMPYATMPIYYALAGMYVHPARIEPWGLVVNEALACGLPVLVSERCGCAPDLVHQGVNGFSFDPENTAALAGLLGKMTKGTENLEAMGRASEAIAADYAPRAFATSLRSALEVAQHRKRGAYRLPKLLIQLSLRG